MKRTIQSKMDMMKQRITAKMWSKKKKKKQKMELLAKNIIKCVKV